jgi:hypothetical protein
MRVASRRRFVGRDRSAFVVIAALSLLIAAGTSVTVAGAATASKTPTRAQKLSKALKACKKQPKNKRAACVKRAKKNYGPRRVGSVGPGSATTPVPAKPPTIPVPPAAPVPPAGPVAPAAITLAEVLRLKCYFNYGCDASHPILNLTVLERAAPRRGTGTFGDNIKEDTWVFPVLFSFDKPEAATRILPCPETEPACGWHPEETYTLTRHTREIRDFEYDVGGTWHLGQPVAWTETCEPALAGCGTTFGGGA